MKRCLAVARWSSVVLLFSGCVTGPLNGDSTNDWSKAILFQGYTDLPGRQVTLQYLARATADPTVNGNWLTLTTATTSMMPTYWHDPAPLYYWSVNDAPGLHVSTEAWPIGGLLRLRAVSADNTIITFDQDFSACFTANSGQSWTVIGNTCRSAFSPVLVFADGGNIPANRDPSITYLDRRGFGDSTAYYDRVFPDSTHPWRDYPTSKQVSSDISVSFYNDGDLGLIRKVSCRESPLDGAVRCMADNFGALEGGANQVQPAWTGGDFIAVDPDLGVAGPDKMVLSAFEAGGPDGWRLTGAPTFSKKGGPTSVPNTCLVCHGGRLDPQGRVVGARLLPLDPATIRPLPGANLAEWQENVRKINDIVMRRGAPTPAMTNVVNGEYAYLVSTPSATADPSYVPPGWSDTDAHEKLYNGLVKPYCRSCHIALSNPLNPTLPTSLNFETFNDFYSFRSQIADDVCKNHQMPNSQHGQTGLWASAGRAYLVGALGLAIGCGATTSI